MRCILILLPICLLLAAPDDPKPSASELKGNVQRGQIIFDEICGECHDRDSKDARVGPGLKGIRDATLPNGTRVTRDKLIEIINRGPGEMRSFKDVFTEQDKADVVDFVLTL